MSLFRSSLAVLKVFALMPLMLLAQQGQEKAGGSAPSKLQVAMDNASAEGKYSFLLFYKKNDAATQAMAKALKEELAKHSNPTMFAMVNAGNAADQALVKEFGFERAPMPIAVAVAPNRAMTAMFSEKITPEQVADSFVTPGMMEAMKALQEGKLVFVTAHGGIKKTSPPALRELQADPHYKDRLAAVSVEIADENEAKFVSQMQIDPRATTSYAVLLAPPGVMVGKFPATASKVQMTAALAKAGKCCDDPNCEHNKPATRTSANPSKPAKK